MDDEVKGEGNSVNYKYRMHDPRIGRFFGLDPLMLQYSELTPYQFSSNSPIGMVEIEGLEGEWKVDIQNAQKAQETALNNGASAEQSKKVYKNYLNTVQPFRNMPDEAAYMILIGLDYLLTGGTVTFLYGLHELGSEMNATDNYHEAKARGDEEAAAEYKEKMEAHGPGSIIPLTELVTPYIIPKGATLLEKMNIRKSLASKWLRPNQMKYVDFSKPVYTTTMKEGQELVQFRVKGSEGTIGNYYAPVGTKPAQIGLDPNKVTQTLSVTVQKETKVLVSTHTKNATYYADESVILEGGGTQYFSSELKNNVSVANTPPNQ